MMVEQITTGIIIAASVLLFAYWFRYTCLLILSAKTARDYAADLVQASGLHVVEVQSELRANRTIDLAELHAALERDYSFIQSLSRGAEEQSILESRMLRIHYSISHVWYSISRYVSATAARNALEEMSTVVMHFANVAGENAAGA
jgi:hypothetical protein